MQQGGVVEPVVSAAGLWLKPSLTSANDVTAFSQV